MKSANDKGQVGAEYQGTLEEVWRIRGDTWRRLLGRHLPKVLADSLQRANVAFDGGGASGEQKTPEAAPALLYTCKVPFTSPADPFNTVKMVWKCSFSAMAPLTTMGKIASFSSEESATVKLRRPSSTGLLMLGPENPTITS